MFSLIVFLINTATYVECSYPRGEGDGISALYISQLCQGTSSGNSFFKSSSLPTSIAWENIINGCADLSLIWVYMHLVAASWFYETESSWLVSRNISSSGLGNESSTWNTAMASVSCRKGMLLPKPQYYTLSLSSFSWIFTVSWMFFSGIASCRYATLF